MMFVVGRTPNRLDGLIVVGQASYLNEIIALAGGENVFRDAVASYPAVSLEEVLARNPDVIVDMGDMADTVGVTDQHKREVTSLWERLTNVAAVKQHRVFAARMCTWCRARGWWKRQGISLRCCNRVGKESSDAARSACATVDLGFAYGLHDASFELPQNGLITIGVPTAREIDAAGDSRGLRSPYLGSCTYDGREVRQWPRRDFARSCSCRKASAWNFLSPRKKWC
jgi:hypothetical protein